MFVPIRVSASDCLQVYGDGPIENIPLLILGLVLPWASGNRT
jgi:hypothetical protein